MVGIGFGLEIERLVTCICLEFACILFVALCREEEIQRIKASNPHNDKYFHLNVGSVA